MPTNTPIPTHSFGDVLSSSDWDTLPPLNNSIGLYGVGSALGGAEPPVTAPNFLIQAGSSTTSTDPNGHFLLTFPNAFPNGLVTCVAILGDSNRINMNIMGASSTGASSSFCYFTLVNTTTGAVVPNVSGAIRYNWIAIGF